MSANQARRRNMTKHDVDVVTSSRNNVDVTTSWRHIDVDMALFRRHYVASSLFQRHIPAGMTKISFSDSFSYYISDLCEVNDHVCPSLRPTVSLSDGCG